MFYSLTSFSLARLCGHLLGATADSGFFPQETVADILALKTADSEIIDLVYGTFCTHRSFVASLPPEEQKALFSLVVEKVENREIGSAQFFKNLMEDLKEKRVSLLSDRAALQHYVRDDGLGRYTFVLFDQYRSLVSDRERRDFTAGICSVTSTIGEGGSYRAASARLAEAGISTGAMEDVLFEILQQVFPVRSYYLTDDALKKIFRDAVSRADELEGSLGLVLPELEAPESGSAAVVEFQEERRKIAWSLRGRLDIPRIDRFVKLSQAFPRAGGNKKMNVLSLFNANTLVEFKDLVHEFVAGQAAASLTPVFEKLAHRDANKKTLGHE